MHSIHSKLDFMMADKSTVYKVHLQIAHVDRHYYHDHSLTLAKHPSETDSRLMVRILAFALNASESLVFSRGLCHEGEPELYAPRLDGTIEEWIFFGQPDEKWLRKACHRSDRVRVYAYGDRTVPVWWQQNQVQLGRYDNLEVWCLEEDTLEQLVGLIERGMRLKVTVCDDEIWVANESVSVSVSLHQLKGART
jgi:uncharacterized protein YaeQ